MTRKQRLAALIAALARPLPSRVAELAERVAARPTVIERDILDLAAAGYPIEGDATEGYRLVRLARLPALTVTEADLDALRVALSQLDPTAAARLRLLVDQALTDELTGLDLDTMTADIPTHAMRASARHLPMLRRAIHRMNPLILTYRAADARETRREVLPLALERWGTAWALAAWCELRSDFRTFRLDRIQSCTVLPEQRPPGPGRDLATFNALYRDRDRDDLA